MVALAQNTSETSSWDVLNTFQKRHSRAREVKTARCTEASHSKSLSRVEIWLMIYESCVGLESFTRDPIGFDGGAYGIYEYCHTKPHIYMDPFGKQIMPPSIDSGYPLYMPAPHTSPTLPTPPVRITPVKPPGWISTAISAAGSIMTNPPPVSELFPEFVSCSIYPCGMESCFLCLMFCGSDYPHSTGLYQLGGVPCRLSARFSCDQFQGIYIDIYSPTLIA